MMVLGAEVILNGEDYILDVNVCMCVSGHMYMSMYVHACACVSV